jgi:hypothetical protein
MTLPGQRALARDSMPVEVHRSHQGRTDMQIATKRGYRRHAQTRTATRKPAWVGPLLTFMVRRGLRFESGRGLEIPANRLLLLPSPAQRRRGLWRGSCTSSFAGAFASEGTSRPGLRELLGYDYEVNFGSAAESGGSRSMPRRWTTSPTRTCPPWPTPRTQW